MSKISKFVKVDKNVLFEYVYDSENNISEAYDILVNSKDRRQSYLATSTSGTYNIQSNSLFKLDNLSNKFGKIDTSNYSFLQVRNYGTSTPIRHDTIRIHLPINWTFGEYLGCYIRVYAYDTLNQVTYDLSNFYFDMTDTGQSYLLNYTSPPLLFQEKLWGKNLSIDIPSLSSISSQRVNNRPKENSINANLTNGNGLSMTTPIFVDFHFINNIQTINGISTYTLSPKVSVTVPQTPEFENLGLVIEHSQNGDFFEIYGIYNGTIGGFKQFIDDSYNTGHRYYVQYSITTYEQNVRGKTVTAIVTENFNESIEFRPIIKTSTTTAMIDVEMRLIDAVDETYVIRRATYGMLQDEVSRYSLNLIKINLKYANKPKIYNIKNSIDPSLVGFSNSMGSIQIPNGRRLPRPGAMSAPTAGSITGTGNVQYIFIDPNTGSQYTPNTPTAESANSTGLVSNAPSNLGSQTPTSNPNVSVETIKVPFPVLIEKSNVMSKSDSAIFNKEKYFADGQIMINIKPFDNIFKFSIATGKPESPQFFNMSGFSEIKFVIKSDLTEVSFPLYTISNDNNLANGQITFKITESKFQDIKKIFNSGINIFYIIGSSQNSRFVIYSGLFKLMDSPANVAELNKTASSLGKPTNPSVLPEIKLDPGVNSPVSNIIKDKLSEQTLPKLKPTGAKDRIEQNLKDKLNPNTFPQKPKK
jgi:hypothetical protein